MLSLLSMLRFNVKSQITLSFLAFGILQISSADDKWRWESNARSNEKSSELRQPAVFKKQFDYIDSRPLPQYEVSESIEGIGARPLQKPPDFRPPADFRPNNGDHDYYDREPLRPNYPNQYPNGNNGGGFGFGAGVRPNYPQNNQGLPKPSFWGDEHPGAVTDNRDGVLTGPVPSWVREPAIKNYDQCKCSVKFNCNSPGISFGQCDVGKQYCCYNSKGNALDGVDPRPQDHSIQNGILVGPGGPTGQRPNRPNLRPFTNRPYEYPSGQHGQHEYANGHPGILVGPGGPTGVIGRPQSQQSQTNRYPQNNGVLVGPGGPTGNIGRPQGLVNRPQNNRYPNEGNSHSINNGILIGPGGPFDYPQRPYGSYQQRPYPRP